MYTIWLRFGVFAGLITVAFSFMLSFNLADCDALVEMLWLRCFGCFILICIRDSAQLI